MSRFTTTLVPNISSLHPAVSGDGLLIAGYASTWNLDKVGDVMNPFALDAAVATFMATNPVLLYAHRLNLPPVGRIIKAEIHRAKGLFIEAVIPRARDGTFAAEIWESVKSGLLRALSLGAVFSRRDRGTHNEIYDVPVVNEISLCPVAIEGSSFTTSVTPTEVKCMADGAYVPKALAAEYKSLMDQRDDLRWLHSRLQRRRDLEDLAYRVARMRLGIPSR